MPNYRYNGVDLPALPETHKHDTGGVAYNYAVIYKHLALDTIYLKFIDKPLLSYHETIMDNRLSLRPLPVTEAYWVYIYKLNENNEWEDMGALINPDHITDHLAAVQGVDPQGVWYQNELIWSNHDIMDSENGGVYFEGSDPVPVPDEPESVLAWKKHDAYKPNSKSIAYLYNGVELPDINTVWTDKATYPCAIITRTISDGTYTLCVCGDKPYYTEQAHGTEGYEPTVIAPKPRKGFVCVGGSWVLNIDETDYGAALPAGTFELIWTNADVMNKDNGSVYLNGSNPVLKGWYGNTFYRVMGGKWVKQDVVVPQMVEDEPAEVVIEWDGDTTGKVTAQSGTFNLVKVSDLTPTYNDLVGAVITAGTETITITEEMLGVSPQDVFVSLLGGMFVSVYDFGIDLPFTELGFYANIEVGAFKLTYTPKT